MGGYLSTTTTYDITDYYGSDWLRGVLKVTVDGSGNGSFTINMTNDWGGTSICSGSMVCYINGTKMHDLYYNANYTPAASANTNPSWTTGFPIRNGSSMSGTFKVSGDSFEVGFSVCRSQSAVTYSNSERLTDGTATGIGPAGKWKETFTRTKWTDVGTGSTTIKDNGNNTFTITATKGADGTNNTAGGPTNLKWGYDSNRTNTYSSGTPISLTISGTSDTRRVYAESTTTATYGDSKKATDYEDIKQYLAPTVPGTISLTAPKGKLTLKENWTLSWGASTKRNDTSPVKGYRIRMFKKSPGESNNNVPIKNSSGNNLSWESATGNGDYIYDTESTATQLTIYPAKQEFKPGDEIGFTIYGYSQYGDGGVIWSRNAAQPDNDNPVCATTGTNPFKVVNAGVVQVKTSSGWKEGQVWVKTSSGWKEAETVNVKTASGWKESQ